MATKTKKTKKTKTAEDAVTPQPSSQPTKPTVKRLLPHNVAHELSLLQQRVAELEQKLQSIVSDK